MECLAGRGEGADPRRHARPRAGAGEWAQAGGIGARPSRLEACYTFADVHTAQPHRRVDRPGSLALAGLIELRPRVSATGACVAAVGGVP